MVATKKVGTIRRQGSLWALATAIFCLTLAGAALAATGDLTAIGCVEDHNSATDDCGGVLAEGLAGAIDVAVSPEGNSVYVVSRGDDAIARFARNATTGALSPRGCIDDNDAGAGSDTCASSTDGLDGLGAVAVSPDGISVYTVGDANDALVRFKRNTTTGNLTPRGCIDDNDTGFDTCATPIDGLGDASDVVISPDGASVYVAGFGDDSIVRFKRNTTTGALAPRGCIDAEGNPGDNCAASAPALDGVHSLAVSPDGTSLYAAGAANDAVLVFRRNTTTGALTPKGCTEDDDTGFGFCAKTSPGLDSAYSVTVSPDGNSVYVAAREDGAVTRFARNSTTGALVGKGCIDDNDPPAGDDLCSSSTNGLHGAADVAVSPDAASVYVSGELDHTVVAFDRNPATGRLLAPSCVRDGAATESCPQTAPGLLGPRGLALSPNSASLYVAAVSDDDVAAFGRELPPP